MLSTSINTLKTIRFALIFYTSFAFTSICFSLGSCSILFVLGIDQLTIAIWFKICTTAVVYYFSNTYQYKTFFYYQNLGVSKRKLWFYSLSFDFILYSTLIALVIFIS